MPGLSANTPNKQLQDLFLVWSELIKRRGLAVPLSPERVELDRLYCQALPLIVELTSCPDEGGMIELVTIAGALLRVINHPTPKSETCLIHP